MSVRLRYAPSPTGDPHLGNLRTAVFAYLYSKQHDGVFMIRLEDTDQTREVEGSAVRILEATDWLGLPADEGIFLENGEVAEKGDFGPYIQSKRLDLYQSNVQTLLQKGVVYRCFCSSERLEEMRAEQQANHLPPRYDGRCRHLPAEESQARADKGESFVIRHAIPENRTVTFNDLVMGEISFQSDDLDDYVLLKSDGFPTYQLANVVDDHLMQISHVFRGNEWIPSTPKNLLLYEAFGWTPPLYAHMPLILGTDKTKLSKRHGANPALYYRDNGYLPEAILNALAFMGWSPGTEEEIFTPAELIQRFQIERVQKSPAVFDIARIDYLNGLYIRKMPVARVAEMMLPYLIKAGLLENIPTGLVLVEKDIILAVTSVEVYLNQVAGAVQERLKRFQEAEEVSWFFFKRPEVSPELKTLLIPKKGDAETTQKVLEQTLNRLERLGLNQWNHEDLEQLLREYIAESGFNAMQVLWPIRAALTGMPGSPGTFEMLAILGQEESLERLRAVVEV